MLFVKKKNQEKNWPTLASPSVNIASCAKVFTCDIENSPGIIYFPNFLCLTI